MKKLKDSIIEQIVHECNTYKISKKAFKKGAKSFKKGLKKAPKK
jgi:hypothetical protein